MEKRRIDLSRCLVRDGKADCHRCEEICPQKAINGHVVDTAACDGCGLCVQPCAPKAIQHYAPVSPIKLVQGGCAA